MRSASLLAVVVLVVILAAMFHGTVFAVDESNPPGGGGTGPIRSQNACPSNAVRAVLVKSWGMVSWPEYIFSDLNTNWASYGSTPICIFDYPDPTITYAGLVATGADVVIISDPAGRPTDAQYSSSEIRAIDEYARAGHNVIGTFLVYQWESFDNRGLLATFGHESTLSFKETGDNYCSLTFNVLDSTDPLFRGIGSTYVSSGYDECQLPTDGTWDDSDLAGARFVAKAADNKAVITVYDDPCYVGIFISSMPEYYGGDWDKQWFYNAITYGKTETALSGGCPLSEAVGGVVTTVNTLFVLAPCIAVIGLVACIGVVGVVAKRRR